MNKNVIGLTSDVSADISHLEERSHMISVDVNGLLLVAAGVDEHLQIPRTTAEPFAHKQKHTHKHMTFC